MSQLPFEVLKLTFQHLPVKQLLQCQLTSKEWYNASVELLYSKVDVTSYKSSLLYVRTISNSANLAKHLKVINFESTLYEKNNVWSNQEDVLLNALLEYCPNVLRIETPGTNSQFWMALSHATTLGQLSRLQELPISNENSKLYLYAALFFKKSLTTLKIQSNESDVEKLRPFQKVFDQLNEFTNLKYLNFDYQSQIRLNDLDVLIEKCPDLDTLEAMILPPYKQETIKESNLLINPHRNIHDFRCYWDLIDTEDQLDYLQQKFPNLGKLTVEFADEYFGPIHDLSVSAIIKFLRHALTIPTFTINMEINKIQLLDVWSELVKIDATYLNVALDYEPVYYSNDRTILNFNEERILIKFIIDEKKSQLPYRTFLSKAGSKIRSLEILNSIDERRDYSTTSSPFYTALNDLNWLLKDLKLCPSLQELSFQMSQDYALSNRIPFQHTKLEKLSITAIGINASLDFLGSMLASFPNLKHLCINYGNIYYHSDKDVIISVPNAQLDVITVVYRDAFYEPGSSIYIRLSTETGVKFYSGNKNGLTSLSEWRYTQDFKSPGVNITIRSLKELRLEWAYYPAVNRFNWVLE